MKKFATHVLCFALADVTENLNRTATKQLDVAPVAHGKEEHVRTPAIEFAAVCVVQRVEIELATDGHGSHHVDDAHAFHEEE